MIGFVMGVLMCFGSFDQIYIGGDVLNNMMVNINFQLVNYSMFQNGIGMFFFGGQGGDQWVQMFLQVGVNYFIFYFIFFY